MAKSFRDTKGKNTSKIVERLGSIEELKAKAGNEDPIAWAKNYVKELSQQEKEENQKISVQYSPTLLIDPTRQRCYNGGYLFLQKIYHDLKLDMICDKISQKYNCK